MGYAKRFRVEQNGEVKLEEIGASYTGEVESKSSGQPLLKEYRRRLRDLQYLMYAENKRSLLVIQGMDASGKDGVINRVLAVMNPQGCRVDSFKTPSAEELAHDYFWRILQNLARTLRLTEGNPRVLDYWNGFAH